ncbi:MAG TPA: hypothetical protein VNG69_17615 [Casimicrobiaceae bacterium]|nr:hypothetical protein [Casimicrobiaceae bacterium]
MNGRNIDVATLLPQAGAMVLLREIVMHDAKRIECRADSHRDPHHPLAQSGMLPIFAGVEYAAQAMAAHFALCDADGEGAATIGLLGALRDVSWTVDRLDDIATSLTIVAERLASDASGSIYAFSVSTGGQALLRGRATVVQRKR